MTYTKPPLTFEQQADLLLGRGLSADRPTLLARLQAVSYYRLSAYWYPFKRPDETFESGTTLDTVWRRYVFDRQLRLFVMDVIERVEVAVRTRLVYELAHQHGAFAHLSVGAFPGIDPAEHRRLVDEMRENAKRSREAFIEHFRTTYDEFPDLPLWVAAEIMTFGNLFTMFRHSGMHVQRTIGSDYGLSGKVLYSWLLVLNYVRNLCAHHSRLWNRELAVKPLIPDRRHDPRWYAGVTVPNNRMFAVLTLLACLMRQIAPQSGWRDRLFSLFDKYPDIPLAAMGIPADWRKHPLWQ